MSYEFFAPLPVDVPRVSSELLQALISRLPLTLVSMTSDKLSLRWNNSPARMEWPEDITLSGDSNGILASIHMGTAQQQSSVLEVLADELAKLTGGPVNFEEP